MITGADKHDPKEGRLWFHVQGREGWKDLFPTFTNKGHVESTSWGAVQVSVGTSAEVGYVNKETVFGGVRWPETGLIASNVSASRKMQLGFIGHTPHHPPEVYY